MNIGLWVLLFPVYPDSLLIVFLVVALTNHDGRGINMSSNYMIKQFSDDNIKSNAEVRYSYRKVSITDWKIIVCPVSSNINPDPYCNSLKNKCLYGIIYMSSFLIHISRHKSL